MRDIRMMSSEAIYESNSSTREGGAASKKVNCFCGDVIDFARAMTRSCIRALIDIYLQEWLELKHIR